MEVPGFDAQPMPSQRGDDHAKQFVDTTDPSRFEPTQIAPPHFESTKKSASLNMRLPDALLDAVKAKAAAQRVPYSRYIRRVLEADLTA